MADSMLSDVLALNLAYARPSCLAPEPFDCTNAGEALLPRGWSAGCRSRVDRGMAYAMEGFGDLLRRLAD